MNTDSLEAPAEREVCAAMLSLSNSELRLMAGEMTAQELRTVRAVLNGLAAMMRVRRAPRADVASLEAPAEQEMGTPGARFSALLDELRLQFPDPEPFSAKAYEGRFLQWLDGLLFAPHPEPAQDAAIALDAPSVAVPPDEPIDMGLPGPGWVSAAVAECLQERLRYANRWRRAVRNVCLARGIAWDADDAISTVALLTDDAALTVLRELVELKDFKDRYAMSVPDSPRSKHWREYQDGLANYRRRKPIAWAAARALADKEPKP